MAKAPDFFTKPAFDDSWSKSKKAADAAAKTGKVTKPWETLQKEFKEDLSPLLKKFAGAWPDLKKIQESNRKATITCINYKKAIQASAKELPPAITKPLLATLDDLLETLDARLLMAESALAAGIPEKPMTSWTLIDLPDLMPRIRAASKNKAALASLPKVPLKVVVTEKKLLECLGKNGNDPLLLQKIKDAVDLDAVGKTVAASFDKALAAYADDPKKGEQWGPKLCQLVEAETAGACKRAVSRLKELDELDSKDTWFKVKLGAEIVLKGLSLVGSAISAGFLTAITFGLASVPGFISVVSNLAGTITAITDFSGEAGKMIETLEKDAKKLAQTYEKAAGGKKKDLNWTEIWRTLAPAVKSIKKLEDQVTLIEKKLMAVELKAHKASKDLTLLLAESDKLEGLVKAANKSVNDDLDKLGKNAPAAWKGLLGVVDSMREALDKGIGAVIDAQTHFTNLTERLATVGEHLQALRTAHTSENLAKVQAGLDLLITGIGALASANTLITKWGKSEAVGTLMTVPATARDGQKQLGILEKECEKAA